MTQSRATKGGFVPASGCFLGFLDRCGSLEPDGPAAANVTADKVEAYIAELKG